VRFYIRRTCNWSEFSPSIHWSTSSGRWSDREQ